MTGEGAKGKGKNGTVGSHMEEKAATYITDVVVPSCAAVPPLVAPAGLDSGAVQASMTLTSLSMTALAARVVGTAQLPQVPGHVKVSFIIKVSYRSMGTLPIDR